MAICTQMLIMVGSTVVMMALESSSQGSKGLRRRGMMSREEMGVRRIMCWEERDGGW